MPLEVALFEAEPRPVYQEVASKARHLRRLGLNDTAIARRLSVTGKTVAKAIAWLEGGERSRPPGAQLPPSD